MRIDMVRTAGTFSLEGQNFDVEDNIWVVGDDSTAVVIDAGHDAAPILEAIGGRAVARILCTHGHNDHINAALELSEATQAPIALHPDDRMLWEEVYPERPFDDALRDGEAIPIADVTLEVLHTPGHSPGGVCFYDGVGHLFAGDTLFRGGPGATGRKYSDWNTIIDSITTRLLVLPTDTVVHPGHGEDTTIGDEAPHLQEWIDRGY
jgi:glyoxylase-like metal-dependent hydrolase (beta-lactamase superfamily II)